MTSWNQALFDEHYKNVTGNQDYVVPGVYWERSNNKSSTGKPQEHLVPGINWEKREREPPKDAVWMYFILYGAIAAVSFILLLVIYCLYRKYCRKKKAINVKQLAKPKTNITSPPPTGKIGINGNGGISSPPTATTSTDRRSPSVNKTTVLKTVQPPGQPLIRHHTHSTTVQTPPQLMTTTTTANPLSPPWLQQTYEEDPQHDSTSTSRIKAAAVVVLIEEVDDEEDDDDEQLCRECGYPASFHK